PGCQLFLLKGAILTLHGSASLLPVAFFKNHCQLLCNSLKTKLKYMLHKLPFQPQRVCYYPKSLTSSSQRIRIEQSSKHFNTRPNPNQVCPKSFVSFQLWLESCELRRV